jgi:hypothetical protein
VDFGATIAQLAAHLDEFGKAFAPAANALFGSFALELLCFRG